MPEYSLPVGNKDLINIARRAFNLVDPRLIGHGARVSYLVFRMPKENFQPENLKPENLKEMYIDTAGKTG